MTMKKVLISGITGQDGSYLAESYLEDGWQVHGIVRRSSTISRPRIDHLFDLDKLSQKQKIILHYGDLNDQSNLMRVISEVEPEQVVNLAAQSHVGVSFSVPIETGIVTGLGATSFLEAIRSVDPTIRFYQAGSSEMFGGVLGRNILDEDSKFQPKSPYAAAKVYAHHMTTCYRESYGMHASNGILFNHESPRRGENFVSRKITLAAARISLGLQSKLYLGNLEARRDWGHAKEYVRAIRLMLDSDNPSDYVVATGRSYSVLDFAKLAFSRLNLNYEEFVYVDESLKRPNEVEDLVGNPSKIKRNLGWEHEISLEMLVNEMVESDLIAAKNGK